MEDKIVNNLIYGYPFFFPIWKAPIDQQKHYKPRLKTERCPHYPVSID